MDPISQGANISSIFALEKKFALREIGSLSALDRFVVKIDLGWLI